MGRHHPSKNDDKQWPAASLTEGAARAAERTDHREHVPDRTDRDDEEQNQAKRP